MKIISSKKYLIALFMGCFLLLSNSYAQDFNPKVIEQVRTMLKAKGLDEDEVKTRLKAKGMDVDKMTPEEVISKKGEIEQVLSEMEAEKDAKPVDAKKGAGIQPVTGAKEATPTGVLPPTKDFKSDFGKTAVVEAIPVSQIEAIADKKQEEVAATLKPSMIYGHKLFRENSLSIYRVSKDASPPESYVLGPGDKINILIFGKSQADLQYEINVNGFIQPNLMPKIFLSGITLKQAKELLKGRFSTYYTFNSDQFALILNTSRTLTINIFGEVEKQGSYTTSALNTALNALSVSGGPTDIGTVRNIQIIRGKTKKVLDVYAFMLNPITQFDFYLQNNDIIYVPPAEKLVSIEGAVNRPMRYELKANEGLKELIDYAGGLLIDAYTNFVQVQSYENNKTVLNDYNLSEVLSGKIKLKLKNGDRIKLRSINSPLKGIVKVSGAVLYDGTYDVASTHTLKQLLEKAKLKPEAKRDQAFVLRKRLDNTSEVMAISLDNILSGKDADLPLENEDQVIIFDLSRYTDQFTVSVVGEVRTPYEQKFRFDGKIQIKEAIALAGGYTNSAATFGYIYRTDPFSVKKTTYIQVDLAKSGDEYLLPGDKLVVLNKYVYEMESSISISGDVQTSVKLRYDSSMTLKDLVLLGGGFTLSSDYKMVDVFRINFDFSSTPVKSIIPLKLDKSYNIVGGNSGFTLQPFDMVVVRKITDFSYQETVEIEGEVMRTGQYMINKSGVYHFSDLIKECGGFTAMGDNYNVTLVRYEDKSGLIVFNAQEALRNKGNIKKDPILTKGDYINVPRLDNTVKVDATGTNYILGANQALLQITYQGSLNAAKYIRNFAGGFASDADLKNIRVTSLNGMVKSTKHFLFIKKYPKVHPGDRISVPLKPIIETKDKKETKPIDWDKYITRMLALFTTLALIKAYSK